MLTYKGLGSDADKDAVHAATKSLNKGLFPGAFCFVAPDIAGDPNYCYLKHTDGAGSKANIAYIAEKEGADSSIWNGIAHDSLVMNIDDMVSVGATEAFQLTNCIDRNPLIISDEAIAQIIIGYKESIQKLSSYVNIYMCGGETADTGNNVRTIVVNSDASARMKKIDIVDASTTSAGDVLVGVASYGQSTYEDRYNSGVSSNGFTLLAHAMLNSSYKEKYPETFDEKIADSAYSGNFDMQTPIPNTSMSLGEALLSPTRTYLPLIKEILRADRDQVKGIFNCTGGGLTKPIRFGKDVKYVIDNLLNPGAFFRFVYENVNVAPRELFKTFNMGCRLIISCSRQGAEDIIKKAHDFEIEAQIIGYVENSSKTGVNQVEITDPLSGEILKYEK
ncbi:phosphoribosylformylglycinamidine cyclo-ligase [Patescibacteria group bacterium]|nr:phosphoribosylformylglycinamidine cyclo-ligase [Patescibacteria group bacterium]